LPDFFAEHAWWPTLSKEVEQAIARCLAAPQFKYALYRAIFSEDGAVEGGVVPELVRILAASYRDIAHATFETEAFVAKRLNISVKTLQNARWRGNGPKYHHPLGPQSRAVRYNTLALNVWMEQNQVASTSEASLRASQFNQLTSSHPQSTIASSGAVKARKGVR